MMFIGPVSSLIEYKNFRFVLSHLPHVSTMLPYVEDLLQYNTALLVRVCSGHYELGTLRTARIPVLELKYPDGTFPRKDIRNNWIYVVETHFRNNPGTAIAIHCKCGLGRSAVLVAIALIESGMSGIEAIDLIRSKRKGAFNTAQYENILNYKSKDRLVTLANEVYLKEECSSISVLDVTKRK